MFVKNVMNKCFQSAVQAIIVFEMYILCREIHCPFQISDLMVNITKHFLEPKYDILSPQEKDKLLKDYDIKDKQVYLPFIQLIV